MRRFQALERHHAKAMRDAMRLRILLRGSALSRYDTLPWGRGTGVTRVSFGTVRPSRQRGVAADAVDHGQRLLADSMRRIWPASSFGLPRKASNVLPAICGTIVTLSNWIRGDPRVRFHVKHVQSGTHDARLATRGSGQVRRPGRCGRCSPAPRRAREPQLFFPDQAMRFGGQAGVDRDHVRLPHQRVQIHRFRRGRVAADEWIVGDDVVPIACK